MVQNKLKIGFKLVTSVLLLTALLGSFLVASASAQGGVTVGYWPLDEVQASGYNTITPDTSNVNPGIVVGHPEPALVNGKIDKAMQFDGANGIYIPIKFVVGFPPTPQPIYMPVSPNLDIQKQVSIKAWINIPALRDEPYNNIVVKADHPDQACSWQNTTRVLGISLRAGTPQTGESYVQGALSGYVYTDQDGFNEIITTQPVPFNQWIHVEFTRTSTGMHLYIDGAEQKATVLHGVQNPQGNIINGTEVYIGHDSYATIDEVSMTDLEPTVTEAAFDIGPNIMIAAIVIAVVFAVAWFLRRAVQIWLIKPKPAT
ncbi:MAG: LamG-like jellyroll fold domain-containing protein [Candidatus Bathyarchaeia archaeon]|jgi:hypothetical protein